MRHAPVLRVVGSQIELVHLRWGFAPGGVVKGSSGSQSRWKDHVGRPKAAPVINFRSKGATLPERPLPGAGLALLRVHGTKSPKSKWRFTKAGEDWFCFAGLWRPAAGGVPEAFTLLTTAPGPDVAPIHNRQMVVLERDDWLAWLNLSRPEAELLQPLPAGSLHVEQVR